MDKPKDSQQILGGSKLKIDFSKPKKPRATTSLLVNIEGGTYSSSSSSTSTSTGSRTSGVQGGRGIDDKITFEAKAFR